MAPRAIFHHESWGTQRSPFGISRVVPCISALLVPLHDALRVAEGVTGLDVISSGRRWVVIGPVIDRMAIIFGRPEPAVRCDRCWA